MTMTHEQRAIAIARDTTDIPIATCTARQGDLMLRRVEAADLPAAPTTRTATRLQLAAGQHGEHWLLAPGIVVLPDGIVVLPEGGSVVHTDVPEARHGTICLAPGAWQHWRLREVLADDTVVEVAD